MMLTAFVLHGGLSAEEINWQVISSGGTGGTSSSFQVSGTLGQTAIGSGSSDSYGLNHGYWQDFGTGGPCDCVPGEADGSGIHNILDVSYIISYLYKSGPTPIPYETCSADADCDCIVNILDVTYIIDYLYKNGPEPCPCAAWVGGCGPLHK